MPPGDATVLAGDCRAILPVLPSRAYGLVLTDPPYGIGYRSSFVRNRAKAKRESDRQRHKWEAIAGDDALDLAWLTDARRVTADVGAWFIFCDLRALDTVWRAVEAAGMDPRSCVVWDRETHGMGNLQRSFSPRADGAVFATCGDWLFPHRRRPPNVLRFPRVHHSAARHPTEKPLALMRYLVETLARPGDVILDPFCGVGSTLVAAAQLGHDALGIELAPGYAREAAVRVHAEKWG